MPSQLDVRRLRVLREVARTGSFSAAAETLAFTQPAISRQIATLEQEAGTRLVERGARGIRLTPAGELLVEHADAILDRLQAARSQLDALAGLRGGTLRLGAFPTAGAALVPMAISAFSAAHSDIELRLDEADSAELVRRLQAGELDLAVVSDHGPPPEGVEYRHLMEDPLVIALPHGHPLAGKDPLHVADLAGETWIEARDSVCAGPLRAAAYAAGFEPRIGFESAQWLGRQGLVAAGVGVALIPTLALATVREDIVLRSVDEPALRRQVHVATLSGGYRCPAVAPMADILRRVADEHCFSCDARVR